jgi:hypothetical protein
MEGYLSYYRRYSESGQGSYGSYYSLATSPCKPGFKYGKDVGVNPGDPREMKCIEFRGDPVTDIETLAHMNYRLQNSPSEPSVGIGVLGAGAMWAFGGLLVIIAFILMYIFEYNSTMLILIIIGLLLIGGGLGLYYGYVVDDQNERTQRYEMDRALYNSRVEPPKWEPIEWAT